MPSAGGHPGHSHDEQGEAASEFQSIGSNDSGCARGGRTPKLANGYFRRARFFAINRHRCSTQIFERIPSSGVFIT